MKSKALHLFRLIPMVLFVVFISCDDSDTSGPSNQPPNTPVYLFPANNSAEVAISVILSWTCTDIDGDPLTYDVYFGIDSDSDPDGIGIVYSDLQSDSCDPGSLGHSMTFYWKIVAKDDHDHETEGPIWSFTTCDSEGWSPGDPPENPNHGEEWTAYLGDNQIPLEMIYIQEGTFMMGAQPDENDRNSDEIPRHQITISQGFWMGKFEVTQLQWETVMGNWDFYSDEGHNRPAESVSHNDITNDFLPELGVKWRLPSEAEWEYACRAGVDDEWFWWGSSYNNLRYHAWYSENSYLHTHEVGQKKSNPWGLCDMHGNVWEWCSDRYDRDYYDSSPLINPLGPDTGSASVLRGGGWDNSNRSCRAAERFRGNPSYHGYNIGFRIVREAD